MRKWLRIKWMKWLRKRTLRVLEGQKVEVQWDNGETTLVCLIDMKWLGDFHYVDNIGEPLGLKWGESEYEG